MKKNDWLIILSLLFCLFIYLFYRTENTVINQIFISVVSFENYDKWRTNITTSLPLSEHIIYSLPEGLWVFCITLTSKIFFVKIGKHELDVVYVPLIFSVGLEIFQLFQLTNGRFDWWDIRLSVVFWATANYIIGQQGIRRNILKPFTFRSFICLLSYLIVYLAHVWK